MPCNFAKTEAENEFKFSLVNVLNAQLVETVTNNADGSFSFSEITLHSAGEYHYHIIEIGEELPGITYDMTTHHVSIAVTDIGGELSGEMLINDQREGVVYDDRVYEISYTVELDENNELLVKCFVNGKEVTEPTIEFQNTYEPYIPKPGDNTNMLALVLMLIFSIGVLAKAVPALWDRISRF